MMIIINGDINIMKNIKFIFIMLGRMIKFLFTGRIEIIFRSPRPYEWFVKFDEYPGPVEHLAMVSGAETMCETIFNENPNEEREFTVVVSKSIFPTPYHKLERVDGYNDIGRDYVWTDTTGIPDMVIWLCPVTVYTFGYYPKILYVKRK